MAHKRGRKKKTKRKKNSNDSLGNNQTRTPSDLSATNRKNDKKKRKKERKGKKNEVTHIHGCLRASAAVMRLAGLTVSMWLMRFLASGVTVSHSGDGYCVRRQSKNLKKKRKKKSC